MPKLSAKKKLRQFLLQRVGEVVTATQLSDAVGPEVTEWARRLRELRREEGWRISSNNDRYDLKPGEYVLEEPPPDIGEYQFSSSISNSLRAEILERNGYICQMCGIGAGDIMDDGRQARMHIGHIIDRDHGGTNERTNLRTLCSQCNQGAKNIVQEPPSYSWLLGRIRTASEADQMEILKWLSKKFQKKGTK